MGQLAFIKDDANVADALPSLMDPGVSTTSQRHYAEGQALMCAFSVAWKSRSWSWRSFSEHDIR